MEKLKERNRIHKIIVINRWHRPLFFSFGKEKIIELFGN